MCHRPIDAPLRGDENRRSGVAGVKSVSNEWIPEFFASLQGAGSAFGALNTFIHEDTLQLRPSDRITTLPQL